MQTHEDLIKYIGKEYNENTKEQIENEFKPYTIMECNVDYFYLEHYITDTIRCVVKNGRILKLGFN